MLRLVGAAQPASFGSPRAAMAESRRSVRSLRSLRSAMPAAGKAAAVLRLGPGSLQVRDESMHDSQAKPPAEQFRDFLNPSVRGDALEAFRHLHKVALSTM